MGEITSIGVDLAKNVLQLHGVKVDGTVALRRQLRRSQVLEFFGHLPPCLVGMEACAGAHFWARELTKLGHDVRLKLVAHDVVGFVDQQIRVDRPELRFGSDKRPLQSPQHLLVKHVQHHRDEHVLLRSSCPSASSEMTTTPSKKAPKDKHFEGSAGLSSVAHGLAGRLEPGVAAGGDRRLAGACCRKAADQEAVEPPDAGAVINHGK